ncbi:MAG: Uma2 family endonuclease [Acidobacteriota bacterium]|nr:Uma2 family endonuclease [Acidobacteriota bacterium]
MTVEQFRAIPDPPGGRYELHHGELVFVPPAPNFHATPQRSLMLALHARCGQTCFVTLEMAFRPCPPELSIEVLSTFPFTPPDAGSQREVFQKRKPSVLDC